MLLTHSLSFALHTSTAATHASFKKLFYAVHTAAVFLCFLQIPGEPSSFNLNEAKVNCSIVGFGNKGYKWQSSPGAAFKEICEIY